MAQKEENNAQAAAGDSEASDTQEESVKKKSESAGDASAKAPAPKLIYIVLLLNLVVLAALVAFVWMNLSKSRKSISLADVEAAKATHEAAPELPVAAKFIKESFTVNLADTAASHFAKVDVEIEVDDDFVRGEVERLKPRIRDFIVVILSSKTYDQIASVDGRDFLREEIRNKINGYLTRGQIKNVYFTQFIIQ